MSPPSLSSKNDNKDFFICDVFDSFKDDIASMEHPVFSLSKKPDHRVLKYEHNGIKITIKPSYTGLATILDKDILLYLASSLMNAKNSGENISKTVRFTSYDYLIATNKGTGGFQYNQLQEGLERLKGTVIQTNIKTNGVEITEEFGLIDAWKIVKENEQGRASSIEISLSNWFYNSVLGNAVLSIDKDYFTLRKPTERRLYELARKHCGNQVTWKIKLENLKTKIGITSQIKALRFNIKKISETNHLPEYNISMEDDVVMFTRKEPPKENKALDYLPKHVTKKEVEAQARPGESYEQARDRIKGLKAALK
ncbi:MAG: replication initiator protein A [Methylococcaceae bacterium]|nr:replication initiator protein A [Methylococcaceae bacterium]